MAIYFFDMDGTLTPSRKKMSYKMAVALGKLSELCQVGIVTGSGMNYVTEQCEILSEVFAIDWNNIHLLPCNGTQWYRWKNKKFQCKHSVDLKSKIGSEKYKLLISEICRGQARLLEGDLKNSEITGTFFQYRKSLLNWCPIGRDSGDDEREAFIILDNQLALRDKEIGGLRKFFQENSLNDLIVAKGGDTSFDIYPKGWDKTYALQHFGNEQIVFVGDKCTGNGNDATIFNACLPEAFETISPEQTYELITRFIDAEKSKVLE